MDFREGQCPFGTYAAALAFYTTVLGSSAFAQNIPDAGRLLKESRPQLAPPPVAAPAIGGQQHTHLEPPNVSSDVRVHVERFDFTGNSAIATETLRQALAASAGKDLNFGELTQTVEMVEAIYKQAGYFLAQAFLPPQKIRDGVVEIAISEGRLGEVRLEGESRVASAVVFGYLDLLPRDSPLTLSVLERQVLLVNELAGGQASLDLQAGEAAGTTDVVLVQKLEDAVNTRLEANNYGLPSTGENRLAGTFNLNGVFNRGERITLSALTSDNAGLSNYSARGELPRGEKGMHLFGSLSRAQYSLGAAFASLKASGTAESVRLGASYPVIRSRGENFRVQLDADSSKLRDEFLASNTLLEKQGQGATMALTYDWLDEAFGGGSNKLDLSMRWGNMDLGTAAAAQDAPPAGQGTAGKYSKVNLTVQRQQTLNRYLSANALLMAQAASKNLDSSEKLSLGGPTSLPGYASGEANADAGYQAKLSLRWQWSPQVSLSTFVDFAALQLSVDPLASSTKNTKRLSDAGFGLDWQMDKHILLNALIAWAGDEAPNPTDNKQPRIWVNAAVVW